MKRGEPLKRTAFRPKRRRPPMDPRLRHEVWVRDTGRCQLCGGGVDEDDFECHHRQLRSQGGPDSHANLITLCHSDHRAVHAHPAKAVERGFICPSTEDPEDWPVYRYLTTWGQPTATGWELPGGRPDSADDGTPGAAS